MNKKEQKWTIFRYDSLSPVIYDQTEPEAMNRFRQIQFPDGRAGIPMISFIASRLKKQVWKTPMSFLWTGWFSEFPRRSYENYKTKLKRRSA